MSARVHALIPAAGRGERFGAVTPKQYALLLGRAVLAHSIEVLNAHPGIAAVTVVLVASDGIYDELVRPIYPGVATVAGGETRAQSVANGLQHIRRSDPSCDWALVHDAARPCLSRARLDELLREGLASPSGAILALPVAETLKLAAGTGRIERTLDRERVWVAQTPQLFPLSLLLDALLAALRSGAPPTDEAEAMERAGFQPLLVRGAPGNIKITGPSDLALAECMLKQGLAA